MDRPKPQPTRIVGGKHEVQLQSGDWLKCESKDDAEVIANISVLEFDSLSGKNNADQCAHASEVLDRYHLGTGSRFFRRRAAEFPESDSNF